MMWFWFTDMPCGEMMWFWFADTPCLLYHTTDSNMHITGSTMYSYVVLPRPT